MDHKNIKHFLPYAIPAGIVFVVLGGFLIYAFVRINSLTKNIDTLTHGLASTNVTLSFTTNQLSSQLSKNFTDLNKQTTGLSKTLTNTQQNIDAVKNQVGGVEQTVGTISGTVGTLQKLSQIDPQLLKKYSKVYFMNENYTPAHLTIAPTEYTYTDTRQEQFLTESWPYLKNLLDGAKSQGITLYIKSGYRSFAEQKSLKTSYSVIYGAGTANAFSADQGYSEHQLGTTLDFITTGTGGQLNGFDKTPSYEWLLNNAFRFGFILSYPKGNKYYIYEPWHWRFVGIKLATYLHDHQRNFYDLDQREIDTYLINTFD
jgi:LAS superfamily LD-carboxypeptidase LdcB